MEQPKWVAISYTLTSKKKSSTRVAIWRRLRRLGAVSPVGGVHILPATEACVEAFQWLAEEVRQAEGQVLVMRVDHFDGLTDQMIIDLFQTARAEEYAELDTQLSEIETQLGDNPSEAAISQNQDGLAKLKRRYAEILATDYFGSYEGKSTAARLEKVTQRLFPELATLPEVPTVSKEAYHGKTWVTRPQPHVDRLASIWLIRKFIDPDAVIRYRVEAEPDEISFDMQGADFGHTGPLCTFETLIKAFEIDVDGLRQLAEIVHEIDLRDERFVHPEAIGIDAVLRGWLLTELSDVQLEERGVALFEGLFQTLAARA